MIAWASIEPFLYDEFESAATRACGRALLPSSGRGFRQFLPMKCEAENGMSRNAQEEK
jgi:hypothetical protein